MTRWPVSTALAYRRVGGGGGGMTWFNFTRMCVSKSEGHGSFFSFKGVK